MLKIACFGQKGGVGKSTIARLVAVSFARTGSRVKIVDLHAKQRTCLEWSAIRSSQSVAPVIVADLFEEPARALHQTDLDIVVLDSGPHDAATVLSTARDVDLVIIPTATSRDDLKPQVEFGLELNRQGVDRSRLLYVVNMANGSETCIDEAKAYVRRHGFSVADTTLVHSASYMNAHDVGRCIAETELAGLNEQSDALFREVVDRIDRLAGGELLEDNSKRTTRLVDCNFKVAPGFHRAFKTAAALNRMSMRELLEVSVRSWISENCKDDPRIRMLCPELFPDKSA
ncbi:ParA family protein [Rhodoplanes sp. SY1]|uniref:ParA family protein n=1 Tax=Rhodoplanes sp. SY1 TaxID=3166646 RepID=UPI0038B67027